MDKYLTDPEITTAASQYEKAYGIFDRLRNALRLSAKGESSMRDPYLLAPNEQQEVTETLTELRDELREKTEESSDSEEQEFCQIVLTHLDDYWPYLVPDEPNEAFVKNGERTTNKLESHWGGAKSARRQTHGHRKLTRDFGALLEEYMLVSNLENPRYVELVLGAIDQLPAKLAEAGQSAGPFSHWRNRRKPLNYGRLPKRLLRKQDFVEKLIRVYNTQRQSLVDEIISSS